MIFFSALPTEVARHYQDGGLDANGHRPERHVAQGNANPCRHCLCMIPAGAPMLILAHRPFPAPQPYAEIGPIFLCANHCTKGGGEVLPEILSSPDYILRGYGADDRIVYGTGNVIATDQIVPKAEQLLRDPRIAYLHLRSARNNCYQCRVDRA